MITIILKKIFYKMIYFAGYFKNPAKFLKRILTNFDELCIIETGVFTIHILPAIANNTVVCNAAVGGSASQLLARAV